MLEPAGRVEQQHHHFGKVDRVTGIGHGQLFKLVGDLGLLAHARRVDQPHRALLAAFGIGPFPVDRDRIAGDPGLGPGQQPVFLEEGIDQR